MNRVVIAAVAVAALVGAGVLGWFEVRQARDFRRLLAVGDAAIAHDQPSSAIEAYSGAIALRRDSMLGWLKRGDTYRRQGDYASALRDLQQASTLDPSAPRPLELLADVQDAVGNHGRAVELYSRFVNLDDREPRIFYKLALAQYRDGHPAAAIDSLRKASALDRRMVEASYLLGLCERDLKHPEQAADAFARAVALDAAFAPAREALAAVDLGLGRRREGLEQLDALAALEPLRQDRLIDLALAYGRAGRLESAVLTLARGAERAAASEDLYLALARVWLDFAEDSNDRVAMQKALEALRLASAIDKDTSEHLLLRGRAQLLSNDAGAAERLLAAATATLPAEPAAFHYLAEAAERVGHHALAQTARARYQALTDNP